LPRAFSSIRPLAWENEFIYSFSQAKGLKVVSTSEDARTIEIIFVYIKNIGSGLKCMMDKSFKSSFSILQDGFLIETCLKGQ